MDKVYVGLDLGSSFFQQAALNLEGAVTMNRRFPTSEENLRSAFTGLRGEIQVHLEAGELAPWAAAIIAVQAYLPARARGHPRPDARAAHGATQNPIDHESHLVNEDTLSR